MDTALRCFQRTVLTLSALLALPAPSRSCSGPTAGVITDVVRLGSYQELEFDFVANNPGRTLFEYMPAAQISCEPGLRRGNLLAALG